MEKKDLGYRHYRVVIHPGKGKNTVRRSICAGVELRGARVKEEKKGENVLKGYKRAGRDRKLIKCGLPRLRCELWYTPHSCKLHELEETPYDLAL